MTDAVVYGECACHSMVDVPSCPHEDEGAHPGDCAAHAACQPYACVCSDDQILAAAAARIGDRPLDSFPRLTDLVIEDDPAAETDY